MGNWGYKPTQSDTFLDILDTFKTNYNLGDTPEESEQLILDEYSKISNDDAEIQDLIFGIAYGHWHINSIKEKHFSQMAEIIEKDFGMELWKEQGEKSYEKRKKSLIEFKNKLKTPRKTILKRKKIKQYICPFDVGDIISIKLENNLFGTALILSRKGDEPQKRVKYGTHYMAFSATKFKNTPSVEDVLQSKILYTKENGGYFIKNIYVATLNKRNLADMLKIGNVEIEKTIREHFQKTTLCFNQAEIEEFFTGINAHNTNELPYDFKLIDILKSTNTWDKMLINRYDLLNMDVRKELKYK